MYPSASGALAACASILLCLVGAAAGQVFAPPPPAADDGNEPAGVLDAAAQESVSAGAVDGAAALTSAADLHPLMHLAFDDGSGTVAHDSTGNGHDGTLVNGPTWVAGVLGGALSFDEYNDIVTVTDFPLAASFSIAFWFRVADNSGIWNQSMFSWGPTYGRNSLNVYIIESGNGEADKLRTVLLDANHSSVQNLDVYDANAYLAGGYLDGHWHHYCLTAATGVGSKVYLDGRLRAFDPNQGGDAIDPNTKLSLGGRYDLNVDRFFGGALDDVWVFGQALAAQDVLALYQGAAGNGAPRASAGADQKVMLPNAVTLVGSVSDDGLPNPPSATTVAWSKVSGPASVSFANANAAVTTATFSAAGVYVLRLTASDSTASSFDDVTITVKLAGDFNGDGLINGADFLIWQQHYPTSSGATTDTGDADGDGKVTGADFLIWQQEYKPV
jgi:hypothetical protein